MSKKIAFGAQIKSFFSLLPVIKRAISEATKPPFKLAIPAQFVRYDVLPLIKSYVKCVALP